MSETEEAIGLHISPWWAGIFASIMASVVVAGILYAWNTNAQQAVMTEKVTRLESTAIPAERIVKIEGQVQANLDTTNRIETKQQRTDDKIDKMDDKLNQLLEGQRDNRRGR